MTASTEQLYETARQLREAIMARADRRTALMCLRQLDLLRDGWNKPAREPSEEEIARFIEAMHRNPRLVPSGDPDDP